MRLSPTIIVSCLSRGSVLVLLAALACGPQVSLDDGTTTQTDGSSSRGDATTTTTTTTTTGVPPSTSGDTTVGPGMMCPGPNPALTCEDLGCGVEEECGFTDFIPSCDDCGPGCVPSSCECDPQTGNWLCTRECVAAPTCYDSVPCAFLCPPDGGGDPLECDVFLQDCPEGEKCMPWANDGGAFWNATRCSPVDPVPGQVGDPCVAEGAGVSGIDDCDRGLMCWNVDGSNVGVCEDMCTGAAVTPVCDNPADVCVLANFGTLALCLPNCDPLLQDCQPGLGCYAAGNDFACISDTPGVTGVHGDACNVSATVLCWECEESCDPGFVCTSADSHSACAGPGCCSTVCSVSDPGADASCAALDPAQVCVPWYAPGTAPAGHEDVGVCAIP